MGLEINHSQNENWIKESGIPHTFLRNSWYVDLNEGLLKSTKKAGVFCYTTDKPGASYGLRREYAETGAKVILRDNNPKVLSKIVEQALGKKIEVKKVTLEEFEKYLDDSRATPVGKFGSINMQKYVEGGNNSEELNNVSDFEKTLGHPLESYVDIMKEYLST